MSLTTTERARRYLAKCPPAVSGLGGHNATFRVAATLVHGFALGEAEALALLADWNRSCVPPWSDADLLHKLRSAATAQHSLARGHLLGAGNMKFPSPTAGSGPAVVRIVPPPKPVFSPAVLKRVAGKAAAVEDVVRFVRERSPVPVDRQDSASFLRWLYPRGSGENVLIFSRMQSQGQMLWKSDQSDLIQNQHLPTGADGVWFLPQPVDGQFHPNPRLGGKQSRRSEESVTSWRYAVLESDEADAEDWLRCLIQMPLLITSICESGGRSIHALVRMNAASKSDWDARVGIIKPVLVTLGADAGALSAVRLSRLPQAWRGQRVQRLLYLNPAPDGMPILRQSAPAPVYGGSVERMGVAA